MDTVFGTFLDPGRNQRPENFVRKSPRAYITDIQGQDLITTVKAASITVYRHQLALVLRSTGVSRWGDIKPASMYPAHPQSSQTFATSPNHLLS